jgi:hypothetical protein
MANEIMAIFDWVYAHLICEFEHWDICLTGLVDRNGEKWLCRVRDDQAENVEYTLTPIEWTPECEEYLEDYRVAYKHWFWENGQRGTYNNWPLAWFAEKWKHRNPITKI